MAEDANGKEKTSILHRPISNRAMEIILVLLLIAIAVFVVIAPTTCGSHHQHGARVAYDLSNLRQWIVQINAYAIDHDGHLPTHIKDAKDYWVDEDFFYSRFDHEDSVVFDETIGPGWYAYGSYWFLFVQDLMLDDIEQPDDFILVYRAPRLDHDFYCVGFLDGHAEILSSEAFAERMQRQDELIRSKGDGFTEHEASARDPI
ncbi:MAG: hypothetical protein KTR15_13660 [Phycisphaeraceae bacterium]|nr:hypothetical protein [Phycisphaeraceae bacterium]